jgi:NADPH-dependent ferric siderophore reductase
MDGHRYGERALLDELPQDANAQVFIEVAEEEHRQELRDELPGVEVRSLVRGAAKDEMHWG